MGYTCIVMLDWESQATYTECTFIMTFLCYWDLEDIDGLVQERRNSIANALELRLSCTEDWATDMCLYIVLFAKPCQEWLYQLQLQSQIALSNVSILNTELLWSNTFVFITHIDGLGQDCSISIANSLKILQSWTKRSL